MNCATCKAELEPGAAFCTNCGTRAPTTAGMHTTQLQTPDVPRMRLPETATEIVPATTWNAYTKTGAETSALAVASLVCGILGIAQILPLIGPIIAVVTGHLARREIRESDGAKTGAGMALAGLIMGYLMLGLYALFCVLGLIFVAAFANYFRL